MITRKRIIRFSLGLITFLTVSYISAMLYIYMMQQSLLYFPTNDIDEISSYSIPDAIDHKLTTSDGTSLQIWYAKPNNNMPLVVYYHGNSWHLGRRAEKFRILREMGYGFVAVSYRGFGKSTGTPSKEGVLTDATAALEFAKSLGDYPLVVIGESLGTGIAVETLSRAQEKINALLLITPYTRISDRAQEKYWFLPVQYLLKDNYNTQDYIHDINAPIMIIHGDNDDVIPHTHAENLADSIEGDKELIIYPGIGHNNYDNRLVLETFHKFVVQHAK